MNNAPPERSETVLYITKINALVTEGREDLIAAIVADYERGTQPIESQSER